MHNKEIKEVFKELNSSENNLTEKEAEKSLNIIFSVG